MRASREPRGVPYDGQPQDTTYPLYDFPMRRYDQTQGRWISPDPAGLAAVDITNPQTWNRYAYVGNRAPSVIDPTGLCGQNNGLPCPPTYQPGTCDGIACPGAGPFGPGGWDSFSLLDVPVGPGLFGIPGLVGFNAYTVGYVPGTDLPILDFEPIFDIGLLPDWLGAGAYGGVTIGQGGPNGPVVLQNPCQVQGRALPPAAYATQGQEANGSTLNFALDIFMGWPKGDYLDAQPLASGNAFQNQAYGNYVFGVYMSAEGASLNGALSGASAFSLASGAYFTYTKNGYQMDPNYPLLPAANVRNITNGYNAYANGTVCHN